MFFHYFETKRYNHLLKIHTLANMHLVRIGISLMTSKTHTVHSQQLSGDQQMASK